MPVKIQVRRDTSSNWASINPVLATGEIGYDTNLGKIKIGNGVDNWTNRPFIGDSIDSDSGVLKAEFMITYDAPALDDWTQHDGYDSSRPFMLINAHSRSYEFPDNGLYRITEDGDVELILSMEQLSGKTIATRRVYENPESNNYYPAFGHLEPDENSLNLHGIRIPSNSVRLNTEISEGDQIFYSMGTSVEAMLIDYFYRLRAVETQSIEYVEKVVKRKPADFAKELGTEIVQRIYFDYDDPEREINRGSYTVVYTPMTQSYYVESRGNNPRIVVARSGDYKGINYVDEYGDLHSAKYPDRKMAMATPIGPEINGTRPEAGTFDASTIMYVRMNNPSPAKISGALVSITGTTPDAVISYSVYAEDEYGGIGGLLYDLGEVDISTPGNKVLNLGTSRLLPKNAVIRIHTPIATEGFLVPPSAMPVLGYNAEALNPATMWVETGPYDAVPPSNPYGPVLSSTHKCPAFRLLTEVYV